MLTLSTTPEVEEIVQIEAAKRGLKAEDYALQIFLDGLNQTQLNHSDAEFEAILNEAISLFDEIPFGTQQLRALKEEEVKLEEAKPQRLFGKSAT